MTNRNNIKYQELIKSLCEALDDRVQMFIEARPWLWNGTQIKKAREDLDEKRAENAVIIEKIVDKIQVLLKPNYSSCTLAELHDLRDKATDWLKDNLDNPMFEEANRRYMAIDDEIQLKEAENIFGGNSKIGQG